MKKNYTSVFISLIILMNTSKTFSQTDAWTQIVGNGFGTVSQNNITGIDAFKSQIFIGTMATSGPGPLQMWKSTTGNSGSFTKVTNYNPALMNQDLGATTMAHTDLTPGYIYMATNNRSAGAVMYRSTDGTAWTKISKRGMGNSKNTKFTPVPIISNIGGAINYLYTGTTDTVSAQSAKIWRMPYDAADSTHWTVAFDFSTIDITVKNVTWLYIYNNKIYACTDGTAGHLYESSNGTTWTKNAGAGIGFGVASNHHIASLAGYKGFLFATTFNTVTGAQVWKTANDTLWTQVTSNAFGIGAGIDEFRRAIVLNGWLWITGQRFTGTAQGDLIWRSKDGITFTQSNTAGFGDSNNNSGFPSLGGFNGFVYHGVGNTVTGTQLWRTNVGVPIAGFTESNTTVCEGATVSFTDTSHVTIAYEWQVNGNTFSTAKDSSYIFVTAGTYTVSLIATNGLINDTAHTIINVTTCTGIVQQLQNTGVTIFPNPTTGKIIINGSNINFIEIYNILGEKIYSSSNCKLQNEIDLSGNPKGIYFVKIKDGTKVCDRKIIVQ